MRALILAGGAGTRLRSVLGDNLNKPMAPVANKPFLEYLVMCLRKQGISEIILCVGYKADLIQSYFGAGNRWNVRLTYSRETEFLGTGGAVKLAEDLVGDKDFLVLNGDSFFDVDLGKLVRLHDETAATATLALAHVDNSQRFGAVRLDATRRIVGFAEKGQEARAGLINGGIYVLTRDVLDLIPPRQMCSLEREIFPALIDHKLYGLPCQGFFIDIGVPADYERLQTDPSPLFVANGEKRQATC
jgi:D-glycero-alpha-D-manno-heptose 1-phosphate guanylyltransferase